MCFCAFVMRIGHFCMLLLLASCLLMTRAHLLDGSLVCGCLQSRSFANPFQILFERSLQSYGSRNWVAGGKSASTAISTRISTTQQTAAQSESELAKNQILQAMALWIPSSYYLQDIHKATACEIGTMARYPSRRRTRSKMSKINKQGCRRGFLSHAQVWQAVNPGGACLYQIQCAPAATASQT